MPSKKSKQGPGKLEGAREALMLVASVPEVGEILHEDRAADRHEAVKPEDVVEDEVLNGILLLFFVHIDL